MGLRVVSANQAIVHFVSDCTYSTGAAVMATCMSSDAVTEGEDFDVSSLGFCFMHVINTLSRMIPFSERSAKKFLKCAVKWIQVEGNPESKFAVKTLDLDQHSLLKTGTATVGVGLAADAIAITDDDEGEGSWKVRSLFLCLRHRRSH